MELASSSSWDSSLLKNPNHCSLLLGRVLRLCGFSRKRIIERAHWGSATSLSSGVVVFTRSCFLSRLLLILLGSLERAYLSLSLVELLLHKSKVRKKKKKEDYGQRKNDLITTPLVSGNNGNGISNVGSSSNNGGRTRGTGSSSGGSGSRSSGVQGAARYLRRAGSRGVMREPSVLVRESAAEHLEERQNDWAYSRPVVVLDLIWNLAFLLVAVAVMILSKDERPRVPLRLWITGYALQCIVHMVCVSLEYRRRRQPQQLVGASSSSSTLVETSASQDAAQAVQDAALDDNVVPSLAKQLESGNTMFSFVWWMFGFGLIISGGEVLIHEAPHLYWLCIVFLAFDVLFVVFCIALAFVIGIAVCCCLPCIIAILYAVAEEKGASEEEINALAKYKFRRTGSNNSSLAKSAPFSGVMSLMGTSDRVTERSIAGEDAECCICLSQYEDGVEVREIPCSHHFHATCVDKWLRINATCPLCKHNIIHGNNNINNRRQEEV